MEANNSAALREALEKINRLCGIGVVEVSSFEIGSICDAALAAPPRNCDIGTADEQIARFDSECLAIRSRNTVEPCAGCPLSEHGEGTEDCQLRWAQMPYQEGGAK